MVSGIEPNDCVTYRWQKRRVRKAVMTKRDESLMQRWGRWWGFAAKEKISLQPPGRSESSRRSADAAADVRPFLRFLLRFHRLPTPKKWETNLNPHPTTPSPPQSVCGPPRLKCQTAQTVHTKDLSVHFTVSVSSDAECKPARPDSDPHERVCFYA